MGIIPTAEGIRMAEERQLDLVEVAPQAAPPVCRILDYGKYRYQLQKKEKDARKKQKVQTLKEMKMRPKIDEHDYDFKVRAIKSFLEDGHRVKVSVFFPWQGDVLPEQGRRSPCTGDRRLRGAWQERRQTPHGRAVHEDNDDAPSPGAGKDCNKTRKE
jgi:hypothetical protein